MEYIYIQNNDIFKLNNPLGDGYNLSLDNSEEDFLSGKIIELNDEQKDFLQKNKNVSTREILKCEINFMPEPTIEQVKAMKIKEISAYDVSSEVNSFVINGLTMWLDRNTRSSLRTTIDAYKAQNLDEITLWNENDNPTAITMHVTALEDLLLNLELYAKQCYDTTATHKRNIQQFTDVQHVIDYDYTADYPSKFNIIL